jgi:hypothetical protein
MQPKLSGTMPSDYAPASRLTPLLQKDKKETDARGLASASD